MSRFVKLGGTYFRPEDIKIISPVADRSDYCRITMTDGSEWTVSTSPAKAVEALNVGQ